VELRRLHCAVLLLNEVGILRMEYPYDAVEHVLIGCSPLVLLTMCGLIPCDEPALLGKAVVCASAAAAAAVPAPPLAPRKLHGNMLIHH
jgi:hypothetical protein